MSPNIILNVIIWALVGLGFWLIMDGAVSIYEYWKQSLPEHSIRVVRVGVGVALIYIAILLNNL